MTDHPMPEPADGGEEIFEATGGDLSDSSLADQIDGSVDELASNNEADGDENAEDQSEHADAEPKGEAPEPFEPPSTDSIEGTQLAKDSAELMQGETRPE